MKTIKALTKEICKREKLKKQVDIAQVSEIVGHLSDIVFEAINDGVLDVLYNNGEKRAKKKAKKK